MANSDKNIVITPATNTSGDPKIVYTPNTAANVITQRLTDAGAISFEGSAGQLFSITNSLSGTLFAVNDVSGIPSIEVIDTGLIKIGQYSGSVVLGSAAALQNASSVSAKLSLITGAAATPGLIVRGVTSQTADLQQWQIDGATVRAKIGANGRVSIGSPAAEFSSAFLSVSSVFTTNPAIVARGAASQTADLIQLQDSAGNTLSGHNAVGQAFTGSTIPIRSAVGGTIQSIATGANPLVTMASAHSLAVGDLVTLASTTGATYDGTFVVATVPLTTTFTITSALTAGQASAAGTVSVPAQMSITTRSAGTEGLTLKGAASQAANMFEIQDSTAAVKFSIRQDGFAVSSQGFQGTINAGQYFVGGVPLTASSYAAGNIVSIIRGAASQSANLTEWQNSSGGILSSVNSAGQFSVVSLNSNGTIPIGASNSQATGLELGNSTGTATTPFIDFHSGATAVDFDARILASGGTGTNGGGTLSYAAASHSFSGNVVGGVSGHRFQAFNEDSKTVKFANWYTSTADQFGQGQLFQEMWFGAINSNTTRRMGFYVNTPDNGTGSVLTTNADMYVTPTGVGIGTAAASVTSQLFVTSKSAARVGSIIRGAASQSTNMLEIQNSAGTVLGGHNAVGQIFTGNTAPLNSGTTTITAASAASATVATYTYGGTVQLVAVGQIVNIAGFTTQAYFNGSFAITAIGGVSGAWTFTVVGTGFTVASATQFGSFSVPGQLSVVSSSPGTKSLLIRGASNQVQSLQEWQSSAGSTLATVNSVGNITAPVFSTTNAYVSFGEGFGGGMMRMTRVTSAPTAPGAAQSRFYFRDGTTAGTLKLMVMAGAAGVETTLIDNIDTTGTDTSTIDGGTP
jgi:hypothetical protein